MTTLGYHINEENGLSIELTIDGTPLASLVGARDAWIPYFLFDDGLPVYPEREGGWRIVAVCSCGEYGCGCTVCRVELQQGDVITFRDFDLDVTANGASQEFTATRQNYDVVVAGILERVRAFRSSREEE